MAKLPKPENWKIDGGPWEKYYGGITPSVFWPLESAADSKPVPPKPDPSMIFRERLNAITSFYPGWIFYPVWMIGTTYAPMQGDMVTITWRCPHGQDIQFGVSQQSISLAIYPTIIADESFKKVVNHCLNSCLGKYQAPQPKSYDNYGSIFGQVEMKVDTEAFENAIKAIKATGGPSMLSAPKPNILAEMIKLVPALQNYIVKQCPELSKCSYWPSWRDVNLSVTVMHLNDTHKWTREQIATWLETLDVDLTIQSQKGNDGKHSASLKEQVEAGLAVISPI